MPQIAETCKADVVEVARSTQGTPTAKLLAILMAAGITDNKELAEITGLSLRSIQHARATHCAQPIAQRNPLRATHCAEAQPIAPDAQPIALARDLQSAHANMESPTEISSSDREQQQQQSRANANDVHAAVVAAAGEALNPISIGLHVVSDVIGWIQDGADLHLDIVPTIEAVSRGKRHSVNSWRFYAGAVAQAKAARLRGLPPAFEVSNSPFARKRLDLSKLKFVEFTPEAAA